MLRFSLLTVTALSHQVAPAPPARAASAPGVLWRARAPACTAAPPAEYDVVVVGSGIGGLCAGVMASRYGLKTLVVESHTEPGGAAHSFERRTKEGTFVFDSGPSLWAGMAHPSMNPLRQCLDAAGVADAVEWVQYDGWGMIIPQGDFFFRVGDDQSWRATLRQFGGPGAEQQWDALMRSVGPVTKASGATTPMVLRSDPAVLVPLLRCLPDLLSAAPYASLLNGPFSLSVQRAGTTDSFIKAWLDYLAFALSGLDATGTLGAAVAYTLGDLYTKGAMLHYPKGGSGAVINALVRGLETHGGALRLGAHVQTILVSDAGRATGVRLANGESIHASVAVVSNADARGTARMLPERWRPAPRPGGGGPLNAAVELTPSFMHLHLAIRAVDLPPGLGIHYSVVLDSFESILGDANMVIVSIPTILDPSLAPAGHHVVHAYLAADEPYAPWHGLDRASDEYKAFKAERAKPLWAALDKIVPGIRSKVVLQMVGSPLTHQRYLRRERGSYGPPLFLSNGETVPYAKTPVDGLLHCGDSTFPGIGVPSAAASGINAANTLVSPWKQLQLMNEMDARGQLRPRTGGGE